MIEIYNEHCLLGSKERIKDSSIDLIVTSPPYNIGTKYNKYKDCMSNDNYLNFMRDISHEFYRILSPKGSIFLNISGIPSNPVMPFDVLNVFLNGFKLQNVFHWIKNINIPQINQSFGHFKPINSKKYVNDCHEYIFHLTLNGDVELDRLAIGVPYQDKSNAKRWGNLEGIRCRGNNWFIAYETTQTQKKHPAAFPIELPKLCMLLHGKNHIQLALDPFLGIGSSALAAQELNIDFIGFEIDKDYCNEAKDRIDKNISKEF